MSIRFNNRQDNLIVDMLENFDEGRGLRWWRRARKGLAWRGHSD
jgi:hypothetical protein